MLLLLVLASFIACPQSYAMLSLNNSMQSPNVTHSTSVQSDRMIEVRDITDPVDDLELHLIHMSPEARARSVKKFTSDPVASCTHIKDHLRSWYNWVRSSEEIEQEVSAYVRIVAEVDSSQTGDLMSVLLAKLKKEYVFQPAELLESARKNKHTALAEYLEAVFNVPVEQTPLHEAARTGNYAACFALLTSFKGPLNQNAYFPKNYQALLAKGESSPEFKATSRALSHCMVQMKKHMDARQELAQRIRSEKNKDGLTAQEVARKASASKELIDLLDPYNRMSLVQAIHQDVVARTNDQTPSSSALKHVFNTEKRHDSKESQEGMNLGDIIVIDGKRYQLVSKKKVV